MVEGDDLHSAQEWEEEGLGICQGMNDIGVHFSAH